MVGYNRHWALIAAVNHAHYRAVSRKSHAMKLVQARYLMHRLILSFASLLIAGPS